MKTAKEWAQEMPCVFPEERQFIRAIQADALRHAIAIAANEYDKGGTIHDVGAALQIAVNALEKETNEKRR